MLAIGSGSDWEVRAPAKLNLFFEIIARRRDGFHEIETLMVPIALFDTMYFHSNTSGHIRLTCQWASPRLSGQGRASEVPSGADNLAARAVRLLQQQSGTGEGATMRLVKRIPAAAGLGGGSSDAAAALAIANRVWGLNWSTERLSLLASELGSDLPFFFSGGAALCRGRGEQISPVEGLAPLHFVVACPPEGLSTVEVYKACQPATQPQTSECLIRSLRRGEAGQAGQLLHNQLEPAARKLSPWIDRTRDMFDQLDFLGHQMSGSGSSYFGVCRHARHAQRLASQLRARGSLRVWTAESCNTGGMGT
jgi:4-diphosphocytidyl-2-C-methyl-D-erythritol kinase